MQPISDLSSISTKNMENYSNISADFDRKLNINSESQLTPDEDEAENEDFSFAINGGNSSPISADDAFKDGQIRPIFPFFNRDLLLGHHDFKFSETRLPVDKIFVQTPPSPSAKTEEDRIATGPYCTGTKTPELSKKSNSTGFSKLWRFKEYMRRSNSADRDAYVFFNQPETKTDVKVVERKNTGEASSEKKTAGASKVCVGGGKKKVLKTKKTLSSHEVYLRNKKGYNPEEEKRRSYLPYRPELVGFFTNVNGGGLSKNVHPY